MLQPVMHSLKGKYIILASGSPRRKELIENIGLRVELCPSLFEEDLDPKSFKGFSEFVQETALQKVLEVENRLKLKGARPDIIIGADTVVTLKGSMFGKPKSKEEAFETLKTLSGKTHTVFTGVIVKSVDKLVKFTEHTDVTFGEIEDEQIKGYIDTGEPMDKAGSYGIQGKGGTFVRRVEGDYFTVVGLPLYKLCEVLYDMARKNNIETRPS